MCGEGEGRRLYKNSNPKFHQTQNLQTFKNHSKAIQNIQNPNSKTIQNSNFKFKNSLETELDLVEDKRAIVFVNTKRACDAVHIQLESMGHR